MRVLACWQFWVQYKNSACNLVASKFKLSDNQSNETQRNLSSKFWWIERVVKLDQKWDKNRKETGTRKAVIWFIPERPIQMQKNVHPCLIDYAKMLIKYNTQFELLGKFDLCCGGGRYIRIIYNSYWEVSVCRRIENEFSKSTKIKMDVREECVFSPDLFNIYTRPQD